MDFPSANIVSPFAPGTFGTLDIGCMATQAMIANRQLATTAAAWPAANRALYFPCIVSAPCTVYKLAVYVGASAGNVDMGLYDEQGAKIRTAADDNGGTAPAMAGTSTLQVFDITDQNINPGIYYLAFVCST